MNTDEPRVSRQPLTEPPPPVEGQIVGHKLSPARVGDRVLVTLEGVLVAYDHDLGKWTLRGHSVPDAHVTWEYELHWGTTFVTIDEAAPGAQFWDRYADGFSGGSCDPGDAPEETR